MTELNTKESKTTIDAINQKNISLNTSRTKEIEKAQNERNNFQNELNKKLSENLSGDNSTSNDSSSLDNFKFLAEQVKELQKGMIAQENIRQNSQLLKKEEQEKDQYNEKIKKNMEEEIQLVNETTIALLNVENLKVQVKKLSKIAKELIKSNKDLEDRLFLLEKDWNKEKIRRSLSPTSSILQSSYDDTTLKSNTFCSEKKNCASCISDPKCGWCKTQKKCSQGDAFGPLDGSCSLYDFGKCSESACLAYKDCSTCLSTDVCGWCPANNLCMEGSRDGPTQTCSSGYSHKDLMSVCPKNNDVITDLVRDLDEKQIK